MHVATGVGARTSFTTTRSPGLKGCSWPSTGIGSAALCLPVFQCQRCNVFAKQLFPIHQLLFVRDIKGEKVNMVRH